jgi:hypothetical protein
MWLLGIELRSSGRTVSAFNHLAISPESIFNSFFFFLIRNFPRLHFQCYPKGPPYPPPNPLPTHSPFLVLTFPCHHPVSIFGYSST